MANKNCNEKANNKGCKLKQFQRNNYFYGKLMTVRDFEDEQEYFINKQRLINRLMFGEGIVCGLSVYQPDNSPTPTTVKITPGVAFDCCGREIILSEERTIDIAEAISNSEEEKTLWITIRYQECLREPVKAVSSVSSCEETCCYSRILEDCKIEVVEQKPENCEYLQADGLCKAWINLMLEPGVDSAKEFIKFWGTCPKFKDRPLILAKIIVSNKKIKSIDNTLYDEQKKLVFSNNKLYTLIKCVENILPDWLKKEQTKVKEINWTHDGKFVWKVIETGNAKDGGDNYIVLKDNTVLLNPNNNYEIEDLDIMVFFYNENGGLIGTSYKKAKSFNPTENQLTVYNNWDNNLVPDKNAKYWLILNQVRKFANLSRRLKITFTEEILKETINNKTLSVTLKPYVSREREERSFFGNMEISLINFNVPVCFGSYSSPDDEPDDEKKSVSFSLFRCPEAEDEYIEYIRNITKPTICETVKNYGLSFYKPTGRGVAGPLLRLANNLKEIIQWVDKLGLRFYIKLRGDFVLDINHNPVDGNHLRGALALPSGNSGNGCPGGDFVSWMDVIIDIKSFRDYVNEIFSEFKAKIHHSEPVNVLKGIGLTETDSYEVLNSWVRNKIIYYDNVSKKYYPMPELHKTVIVYDPKYEYTKKNAEIMKEDLLKAHGYEVNVKSSENLTDEDFKNNDIIVIRGKDVTEITDKKFKNIRTKVKWNLSEGEHEIVDNPYRRNSNVFILGGKDDQAVKKAVKKFIGHLQRIKGV